MTGVNLTIHVGTVGRDPDVKSLTSGSVVANFSIAVNEKWTDKSGQKQERTEWIRVVAFGRLAEIVSQYIHKGSKLYVEGKLQTRSWEQDGQKRYITEVNARNIQMLDSRQQSNQSPEPAQTYQDDEDVPF